MPGTARYIIHQQGGNCLIWDTVAEKDLEGGPTSVEGAVQAALNLGWQDDHTLGPGDVYITAGVYAIHDENFPGWNVRNFTYLRMDPLTQIVVPNGFAHAVFVLLADDPNTDPDNQLGVTNATIDGGWIQEQQDPDGRRGPATEAQGNWTAFLLNANAGTGGMQFNKLCNTRVDNASVGISLTVGLGKETYINSNVFDGLRLYACRNFINFALAKPLSYYTYVPVWGNTFANIQCQRGKDKYNPIPTTVGVNDISGYQNAFITVNVWDIPDNAKKMVITDQANLTTIVGGILYEPENDHGQNTRPYGY